MDRRRRTFLKTAGVAAVAPAIAKAKPLISDDASDSKKIQANLTAVAAHFHNESANEVEKACALYTTDIVWEAPARNLLFRDKNDVVANYKKMFASMKDVKFRMLDRFATADRVVDDSEVTVTVTGPDFLPVPIGSKINMRLVHIFEMREGKIAKEIAYEMWKVV